VDPTLPLEKQRYGKRRERRERLDGGNEIHYIYSSMWTPI
jgi:hypothetical protein